MWAIQESRRAWLTQTRGVAEWSNAAVLKTVVPKGTGGSNPSSSANGRLLCGAQPQVDKDRELVERPGTTMVPIALRPGGSLHCFESLTPGLCGLALTLAVT